MKAHHKAELNRFRTFINLLSRLKYLPDFLNYQVSLRVESLPFEARERKRCSNA